MEILSEEALRAALILDHSTAVIVPLAPDTPHKPVCCCPKEMRIDGVDYIVRGGVYDAGCQVHNPCQSRYVPTVGITCREMKRDGRKHASHSVREDS